MKAAQWIGLILVLLPLALLALSFVHHGHIDERLDVAVRIVDRDTGGPLEDAVVAIVRYPSQLEYEDFELYLKEGLRAASEEWGNHCWCAPEVPCARTTKSAETTVRGSVYVMRYWLGPVQISKEVGVPDVLLIDHPRFGRTIIPIDQESVLEEGCEPKTWRLDLGTVQLPR